MTSSVIFSRNINPNIDGEKCPICREPFQSSDERVSHCIQVVNGELHHTFHKKCIVNWGKRQSTCPLCRMSTNFNDLLTLKERVHNIWQQHFMGFITLITGAAVAGFLETRSIELTAEITGISVLASIVLAVVCGDVCLGPLSLPESEEGSETYWEQSLW